MSNLQKNYGVQNNEKGKIKMKTITSIAAILLFTVLMLIPNINNTFAGPRFGFYVGYGVPRIAAERPLYERVWVEGHYEYNKYGRLVWVPAHWKRI